MSIPATIYFLTETSIKWKLINFGSIGFRHVPLTKSYYQQFLPAVNFETDGEKAVLLTGHQMENFTFFSTLSQLSVIALL